MVDVVPVTVTSPLPWPSASVRAVTAFTWASVARVRSTGAVVAASSSSTIAAQCSGALPGP